MESMLSHSTRHWKISVPRVLTIPRSFITAILISIFILAFVISSYWNKPGVSQNETLLRDLTVILGITWGVLGSGKVAVKIKPVKFAYIVFFFSALLILNLSPLTSVIPWRGDEDVHIRLALRLIEHFHWYEWAIVASGWLLILYLSWHRPKLAVVFGLIFFYLLISNYSQYPVIFYDRYPFANYWYFSAIVSLITPVVGHPYHELLYRLIPFISVVALVSVVQNQLDGKDWVLRIFWGLGIAVTPIVYYYSSILYLEMPAILLMTIVCLKIKDLLTLDFSELKSNVGWYALILIGFIKETTLPFLFCFLVFRTAYPIFLIIKEKRTPLPIGDSIKAEDQYSVFSKVGNVLLTYFLLLTPILYFFAVQNKDVARGFHLSISNLLDPEIYIVYLRALFEQFGLLILLFLGGLINTLHKRAYPSFLFFVFLFIGYSLFFMIDEKIYIGYSRFNLFLLPPVIAVSTLLLKSIISSRKWLAFVVISAGILSALLLSPIQRDGTKTPYWGNYLFDTSEHYYPMDSAISWLSENEPEENLLISGLYYQYFIKFYFNKYNWHPDPYEILLIEKGSLDDQENLETALSKADEEGFDKVLFFVMGESLPEAPPGSDFHQEAVFLNLSHELLLFSRDADQ